MGLCLWKVEICSYKIRHGRHHRNFLAINLNQSSAFISWYLLIHSEMHIDRVYSVPPGLLTAASIHGDIGWFQRPHFCGFSKPIRQCPLRPHCLPRTAPCRGGGMSSLLTVVIPSNPFPAWKKSFFFPLLSSKPFHNFPSSFTFHYLLLSKF